MELQAFPPSHLLLHVSNIFRNPKGNQFFLCFVSYDKAPSVFPVLYSKKEIEKNFQWKQFAVSTQNPASGC